MTALSDALAKPNAKKVILAEITAGKHQPVWEEAWNPYIHAGLVFSVWAEDIEGEDGDSLISIKEKVSGTTFSKWNPASEITLNCSDSTINGRKSVTLTGSNYFQTIQKVSLPTYYAEDAFTWVFLFKKVKDNATVWPVGAEVDTMFRTADKAIDNVVVLHGEQVVFDPGTIDDGEWHIWTLIRDGDVFSIRIDGTLIDTQTISSATHLNLLVDKYMLVFEATYGVGESGSTSFAGSFMFKTAIDPAEFEKGLRNYYQLGDKGTGASTLWTTPEEYTVSGVKINGTSLSLATSPLNCAATASSYYWDGKRIFIKSTTDPSDWDNTTIVFLRFNFSTESRTLNVEYYDGRIKGIPAMNIRVEEEFKGVAVIGGGSVILSNGDRFFNSLSGIRWDAGTTTIKMGCDTRLSTMAYSDYASFSTWNNDAWNTGNDFELVVIEPRDRLNKDLPFSVYDRSEFPNLHESHAGRSKSILYGKVYGVQATCINIETKQFEVAGHSVYSIDRARAEKDDVLSGIAITSIDLTNARFIYALWDGQQEVTVDVTGKVDSDGELIQNAADIVEDIITNCGITNVNAASFLAAHNILDRGYYYPGNTRLSSFSPCVYMGSPTNALDTISEINSTVGAYLYINEAGEYCYKIFEPERVENLTSFKEDSIAELTVEVETDNRPSYLHVKYAKRNDEDWAVDYIIEKDRNQYLRDEKSEIKDERDVIVSDEENAALYANKVMIYEGNINKVFKIEFNDPKAALLRQAEQFHLQFELDTETNKYTFDEVLEVYSMSFDPSNMDKITVVAGNRHGFGDLPGYWVGDSETLPTRFASLAGYGSGSIVWNKAWHRRIKDWARQNYGYWTDDNGFADSSDPDSYIPSCLV